MCIKMGKRELGTAINSGNQNDAEDLLKKSNWRERLYESDCYYTKIQEIGEGDPDIGITVCIDV